MDRCSYFIEGKALFGSHPKQPTVDILENEGIILFIDLTEFDEPGLTPYTTKKRYIRYPIKDRKVPDNWRTFSQLILCICEEIKKLKDNEKIYINCKGGHGRSGLVVACVLCEYYGILPELALKMTDNFHQKRKEMTEKLRKAGSPRGKNQKHFVLNFFKEIHYYRPYQKGFTAGMNNITHHPIDIAGLGSFANAYFAFHAHKSPSDTEYVNTLEKATSIDDNIKDLVRKHTPLDWENRKYQAMYNVLYAKFTQHYYICENLMNTGLRPLIKISTDNYWGSGICGKGFNYHGRILQEVRKKLLLSTCVFN